MTGRSWAGTTLADRRTERRRALLEAALELAGAEGSRAVTVRSVCRVAKLTDRYFYENFADRDTLLLAVFDEVADEAGRVLLGSVADIASDRPEDLARAAVGAFLDLLTGDPRKARLLLLEPLTDPVLGERGAALTPVFADIIRAQLDGDSVDEIDAQLTGTALVGAMVNLFAGWLGGSLDVDRGRLADYAVRLLVAAMAVPARG